jgi:hypothetical protein
LDADGRPAEKVRIRLYRLDDQSGADPRVIGSSDDCLELDGSTLPFQTWTDGDGRFRVDGLPSHTHVSLVTEDARFGRKCLNCATFAPSEIDRFNATGKRTPEETLLPDGFSVKLAPSHTVRGRITYADTRKPAADSRLRLAGINVIADSQGRFSIQGLEPRKYPYSVQPHESVPYLFSFGELTVPSDRLIGEHDIVLERGAVITGQIRAKETGEPLRVPNVSVYFRSDVGRGALFSTLTHTNGSFRMVVPFG